MNLAQTITLNAGGPGSGCNPAAGKCGRPAGTATYYHGTTDAAVSSIQRNGIQQDNAARFHFRLDVGDYMRDKFEEINTPEGHVYFTPDPKAAKWYADLKTKMARAEPGSTFEHPEGPGSQLSMSVEKPANAPVDKSAKPAVVTIEVPSDFAKEKDPSSKMAFESLRTKSIPAKYVKNIEVDSKPLEKYWSSTDPTPPFDPVAWKAKMAKFDQERIARDVAETKRSLIERGIIKAGGPGSGCNPEVGKCGRPPKGVSDVPTRELNPGETTEQAWRDPVTGAWDAGREAFHNAFTDKMLQGHVPPTGRPPVATILGGGTASGKTTASAVILGEDHNILRVDPDEIKVAIPEFAGLKETDKEHAAFRVHEESSYMTKMVMAKAIANKLDLTYDSTTSGNGGPAMARFLASEGYDVHVKFFDAPIQAAMQRAAWRAEHSDKPMNRGRIVPESEIRKSHQGAAQKFQEIKDLPGIKSTQFYDTTNPTPRLIYERQGLGEEKIHDLGRWQQYKNKAAGLAEVSAARWNGFGPLSNARGRGRIEADGRERKDTQKPKVSALMKHVQRRHRMRIWAP